MMKKIKQAPLLLAGFILILSAIAFQLPTLAQEVIYDEIDSATGLVYEDPSLVEEPYLGEIDPIEPISGTTLNSSIPNNAVPPSCTDGYKNWKKSSTLKTNVPWSMQFMKRRMGGQGYTQANYENERFMDLNGDGLPDYLYSFRMSGYSNSTTVYSDEACVYLNTGSGFQKVYQCVSRQELNGQQSFYGDCAA